MFRYLWLDSNCKRAINTANPRGRICSHNYPESLSSHHNKGLSESCVCVCVCGLERIGKTSLAERGSDGRSQTSGCGCSNISHYWVTASVGHMPLKKQHAQNQNRKFFQKSFNNYLSSRLRNDRFENVWCTVKCLTNMKNTPSDKQPADFLTYDS